MIQRSCRILLILSLLFALGWLIPDGSGFNDRIAYWQASELRVDGNGEKIGDGTAYWQLPKHFMFEYSHRSHPDSGKEGKSLGFMGNFRTVALNYEAGNFTILVEGYWLEIAAGLAVLPLLHWVWAWHARRLASQPGFPLD